MMKNSLSRRFLRSYKKNTAAIFLSFALTFLLLTVLLTLIHTNFRISGIQAQAEFTPSDCYIDGLSQEQVDTLAADPEISWMGVQQGESRLYERNHQQVHVTRNDGEAATMMATVLEGRLPEGEGEVAAEKWTLLNLGVEPAVNQRISLTDPDTGQEEEFLLTGILSDIYANKKYGLLSLSAACSPQPEEENLVYLKFSEGTGYEEKTTRLQEELGIAKDQIRECPAREDRGRLYLLDAELAGLILLICMVVFYGVYRISLLSRLPQYGVLRAIGMTRKELRGVMLRELYLIYLPAVPAGICLGLLTARGILLVSGDADSQVYLHNEAVRFSLEIPVLPILLCAAAAAVCIGGICLAAAKKAIRQPVIGMITGNPGGRKDAGTVCEIGRAGSKTGMLFRMGCKYLRKDLRTTGFVILTICVGVVLFTGLAYKARTLNIYREDTRELYYLNGQYAMTMQYFNQTGQGISRDSAREIAGTEGVRNVKTSSALPVRVLDDEEIRRNEEYYDRYNQSLEEIYGYSSAGFDGRDSVYKSFLCGYNTAAQKALRPYVLEGDFDPEGLREDEVILAVLRTDNTGENQTPASYREGTPLMDYHAGDTIRIKYRADLETDLPEYENFSDTNARYVYRTYRVAAVVSFAYMYDCRRTVYPLLITDDRFIRQIAPDSAIQCMYLDGEAGMSQERQTQLERQLIRAGSRNSNVSTRSLISEIRQNEMFYYKQMVYITGIAVTAFVLVLINMANTLRYRMQSRSREICMLRAVGMSIPMVRRMLLFENLTMGGAAIVLSFAVLQPVLRYLYAASDMKAFGHGFSFDAAAFLLVAAGALAVCAALSVRILKVWKSRNVAEGIGRFE